MIHKLTHKNIKKKNWYHQRIKDFDEAIPCAIKLRLIFCIYFKKNLKCSKKLDLTRKHLSYLISIVTIANKVKLTLSIPLLASVNVIGYKKEVKKIISCVDTFWLYLANGAMWLLLPKNACNDWKIFTHLSGPRPKTSSAHAIVVSPVLNCLLVVTPSRLGIFLACLAVHEMYMGDTLLMPGSSYYVFVVCELLFFFFHILYEHDG